jgi:F-type H+-transporting ATPase subunit epsilon
MTSSEAQQHGTAAEQAPLTLEILTPAGVAVACPADEIVLPTVEGDIGILEGHVALLAALRVGVVQAVRGQRPRYYLVLTGYAQVDARAVYVMTSSCVEIGEQGAEAIASGSMDESLTAGLSLSDFRRYERWAGIVPGRVWRFDDREDGSYRAVRIDRDGLTWFGQGMLAEEGVEQLQPRLYTGPTQWFTDFVEKGPLWECPPELVQELRDYLRIFDAAAETQRRRPTEGLVQTAGPPGRTWAP